MKLRDSLPNKGRKEIVIFAIDRKPTENIRLNGLYIDRAVSARGFILFPIKGGSLKLRLTT